jgi:hypothetical protein
MVKTKGGNSYINEFVDEMTRGITGNKMTGGATKLKFRGVKGGSVELAPLLVSLMTLGMRVASDPKLSDVYKKHTKMSGGSDDILKNEYEMNTSQFGGNGIYDMFANALENVPSVEGGSKIKKSRGRKYKGGSDEDMNNGQEFGEESMGVPNASDAPNAPEAPEAPEAPDASDAPDASIDYDDIDNIEGGDSCEISGGKYKRKGKQQRRKVAKAKGGAAGMDEMFAQFDPSSYASSTASKGGKGKSRSKTRGGSSDMEQMISEMSESVPSVTGGKSMKSRSRSVKSRGGSAMEHMMAEMTHDTATGGRRKTNRRARSPSVKSRGGSSCGMNQQEGGKPKKTRKTKGGSAVEANSLLPLSMQELK